MIQYHDEIWKEIKGYEGLYSISNYGRVKSYHNNKEIIKRIVEESTGYYKVNLFKDGKSKTKRIHRLVAEAFVENDNPKEKNEVDHIDTVRSNNRANNLRWVTRKENSSNDKTIEKIKKNAISNNGRAQKIIRNDGIIFNSMREAAKECQTSHGSISLCCDGKKDFAGYLPNGEKAKWQRVNSKAMI